MILVVRVSRRLALFSILSVCTLFPFAVGNAPKLCTGRLNRSVANAKLRVD